MIIIKKVAFYLFYSFLLFVGFSFITIFLTGSISDNVAFLQIIIALLLTQIVMGIFMFVCFMEKQK